MYGNLCLSGKTIQVHFSSLPENHFPMFERMCEIRSSKLASDSYQGTLQENEAFNLCYTIANEWFILL